MQLRGNIVHLKSHLMLEMNANNKFRIFLSYKFTLNCNSKRVFSSFITFICIPKFLIRLHFKGVWQKYSLSVVSISSVPGLVQFYIN